MKAKETFEQLQNKKISFSLKGRLTLSMAIVVICSMTIAFGISSTLAFIFPIIEGIPFFIQFIVFSLIVSTVSTRFFSRIFFKPIKTLRDGLKEVSLGNFDIQLETRSSSVEIQEIFAGFNMMTQELKATEILQTDFVSNVSHEFKTPITAIEGYTTLLQSCDNITQPQCEYVDKILFNTKRLSSLVSNILLLSKLENQSITTSRTQYKLDEQIREDILALETEWESKNIEFDLNLQSIEYYGNEGMLHHIWSNLISNAIKFSPQNSVIKICLKKSDKYIIFTIDDCGKGISKQEEKHIFDKFYQGDSSHKETGNGLGLALVKRILVLENGDITVNNLLPKGCRFTITLPIQD